VIEVALEMKAEGVSVFGVNDSLSWLVDMGLTEPEGTLFHSDNSPKPAFYAIQDVLAAGSN